MLESLLIFALVPLCESAYLKNAVDLTHQAGNGVTIQWPSATPLNVKRVFKGVTDSGFFYYENDFTQTEHAGTHADAPSHFTEGKWNLGDIPLDRLAGPGVVVDISERAAQDPDTQLTVDDLIRWENNHGQIPEGAVVIMNSGRWKKYYQKREYLGYPQDVEDETDTANLHFPGFHPDAVDWLIKNRHIIGIAVDTPSTDRGQSKDFLIHQRLGASNVWAIENIANLGDLPPRGFTLFNMVYRLKEGSGGPTRVFAITDNPRPYGFVQISTEL